MAKGYAINEVGRGGIIVGSVSETMRGALVNWLYSSKKLLITNDWSDEAIFSAWDTFRTSNDHIVEVEITGVAAVEL